MKVILNIPSIVITDETAKVFKAWLKYKIDFPFESDDLFRYITDFAIYDDKEITVNKEVV